MNCKHCQAELPEGVTVCPECGEAAPVQKKHSAGVIALAVAAVVVLAAVFIALIVSGLNTTTQPEETDPTESTGETVPATTPADTGLDDETCKGTYTADDDTVAAAMDTVVARLGDAELTNSQLQVFYWMEVSGFYSQYYYYASMLGIDFTQPLDTQLCALVETPLTWQQYFLGCAINNWLNYQVLEMEADAADFSISDATKEMLEVFPESFAEEAETAGYESVDLYLYDNLGAGAELEDYGYFLELVYAGGEYFDQLRANIAPTDEEIEAYFAEHEDEYAANGLTRDSYTVDVRHILIFPEGATSETIRTETFSDEAWAKGKEKAEQLLTQWEAGDKSEESFASFANEHSEDPGSNANGGLYTGIYTGQMVESFENWCFDESREVGDYGIVQSELGFHIMFFSGRNYTWPETAKTDLINEISRDMLGEMMEKYECEVDYESILIGTAGIFKSVG